MTKEIEALMILQNESFNYPCYTDNYLMESWNYIDIDSSKTKSRIPDDDINSIAIFSDICKTPKEQKMTTCSHVASPFKPMDRTPNGSSPELTQLQNSHLLKMVSGNISTTQSQVMKQISPSNNNNNNYIQAVAGDSYEKQAINNIFDSLMLNTHKMWPSDISYPSDSTEPPGYGTEFVGHPSPDYSSSYSNSPPERYRNDFQFILGAAQASQNKNTEIPMVYLNKGQFYPITLQGVDSSAGIPCSKVKTVIMAVFENDKNPEMQLKCWNHWHARQPTAKQRVIDIADYKEVFSGISNIEEVAFNALSFIWNTNEEAKVYIGINSLSTDFSSQKGVKGVPLNLQIDTYDFSSGTNRLIHRAACQIKIFCDKGAERKMRDEERKRVRRRSKNVADSTNGGKQTLVSSSMGKDCTYFKALDDHVTLPVLFIPETHYSNLQRLAVTTSTEESDKNPLKRVACFSDLGEQCGSPPSKQPRREEQQRVLLYVRQESEEVFDALMLNSPTLRGLRQAISEKYGLQEDTIGKIFKKCKRGIFVNMDDNIIEHYSNHTAFLIEITEVMLNQYQVTLLEL